MQRFLLSFIASLLAVLVFVVMAAVNCCRLQARPEAPSIGEMGMYVGLPVVLSLAAIAFVVFLCTRLKVDPPMTPPAGPASPPATIRPVSPYRFPTDDLVLHEPPDAPTEAVDKEAHRSRIWSIIDELSDAMLDDEAGSEALFVVRERFHRLQFAPVEPEAEPTPAPKAQAKPVAA